MRILLLLMMLWPAAAHAETWVVMPVFSDHPPPRDPTLLRMSVELAKAIGEAVSGHVRLAKREERESSCPDECPAEIASMLEVEHVVALHLSDDYDQLAVVTFAPSRRPEIRRIACSYADGAVSCDTKQLIEVFKSKKAAAGLDEQLIQSAFGGLASQLAACGEQNAKIEASVRFRVRPDGRVTDVRIDPPSVENQKPYDCMARVVESLRVPPFSGNKPVAFHLPLPKGK